MKRAKWFETYYDFRNNGTSPGLATDYWLVHADPASGLTNPASWQQDEKRLTSLADGTTGAPFNMENAPPTSRGYFLGDYQGLAAAGTSFYALFGQAGSGASDPSNIWFRDPPPAPEATPAPQPRWPWVTFRASGLFSLAENLVG